VIGAQPSVAVLLPVYNCESFIGECLESILNQSYNNFSIIIVDDCSSDNTVEIIQRYCLRNNRIELHQNEKNLGIIESRNLLIELSDAQYLAFTDADDLSLPNRLEAQVEHLEQHQDIHALSCWYTRFGVIEDTIRTPTSSEDIASALFLDNVICNPAIMVRTEFLKLNSLKYDSSFRGAADFKLWVECSKVGRLECLPQVLFQYRTHHSQESHMNNQRQRDAHFRIVDEQFLRLGLSINAEELKSLVWPAECQYIDLLELGTWLQKASENKNITHKELSSNVFSFLDIRLRSCCKRFGLGGVWCYVKSRGFSNLMKGHNLGLRFLIDCLRT
jgi:glycosyltransferase involved in cell wall biosynthesis